MSSEALAIDWDNILDKFSSYEGTIKPFCEEHDISIHQLYYRRKRLKNNNNTVFHGISFNEKETMKDIDSQSNPSRSCISSNIKIEIGKARIHIPNNDKVSLANILEVIIKSC